MPASPVGLVLLASRVVRALVRARERTSLVADLLYRDERRAPERVRIRYRSEGIDGPPLVLLHGRTANHSDWDGITERLATRLRVYVPDLRGHGARDYPGTYPLPEMAEDIVGLLDHLEIGKAAIIGHSLGGMVAYHLAANHQKRVEVLVTA